MRVLRRALAIILWPLALVAAAAALAAHGGRFSAHLDALTHFALIYLAAAATALVGAPLMARGARRALAMVAFAGIAASAGLLLPEVLPSRLEPRAPADAPGQIKVIQFNAWTRNTTPDKAAAWILAQRPDILVMEEGLGITDRLVAAGYYAACRGCGALIFAHRKAAWSSGREPRDPRTRYMAAVSYRDAYGEYVVAGVHRSWPLPIRRDREEASGLHAYLAALPKQRMILAGDFNSAGWSFARQRYDRELGLIRRTRALPTWPAGRVSHNRLPAPFPYLPIDHVYAGPGWATVKVERGPALGSDHYPVIVTLAPVESASK